MARRWSYPSFVGPGSSAWRPWPKPWRDWPIGPAATSLGLDEVSGATFTLTNVGAQGTVLAVPIINQPQVAILSTDGVRPRPVAQTGPEGEWAVTVHPVGNLSLSFDHRAIDGAYAAAFLARVRTTLEARTWTDEVNGG